MMDTGQLRTELSNDPTRILVGVDGSESATAALEWASTEAQRRGAILEIHAASGAGSLFSDGRATLDTHQILTWAIEHTRQTAPELLTVMKADAGLAPPALIQASDGAELLVVGSRGLGGFNGLRLGSVSRQCAHGAHCPVAIVRPMEQPVASASPEPVRIVVGLDGSPSSLAALDWAATEAGLRSAYVEVLTAWESLDLTSVSYDPKGIAQTFLDTAVETAREARREVDFRPLVVEGHPSQALVEASRGADLVVVGSRGHGALFAVLLGSVSAYCSTHAHCPVVVHRVADSVST